MFSILLLKVNMNFKFKLASFGLISLLLFVAGCGNADDDWFCLPDVDPLCEFQKDFASYDLDDTIYYTHSNGKDFELIVTLDSTYYKSGGQFYPKKDSIPCTTGETKATRLRKVLLESEYPMISISLEMNGDNSTDQNIKLRMGELEFILDDTDFDKNTIDTLEVNGKKYFDVAMVKGSRVMKNGGKSETEAKVYYTHQKGFIKIVLDDQSYIAIK